MTNFGYFVLFLVLYSLFRRAEIFLGVILVLQAAAVHVSVDNLDVVGHVARLVEGMALCQPFAAPCFYLPSGCWRRGDLSN